MSEQFVPVDLNKPTPTAAPPAPNGFADDALFAPLDTSSSPIDLEPGDPNVPASVTPSVSDELTPPEPAPAPAAPAAAQPEVHEFEDGSALTVERTNKGWRAVLDSGAGNAEVFYGKTKEEMWTNVASAKMHATRKIRELDRKVKLTARPEPVQAAPLQPVPQVRQLTADEVVELQEKLKADPGLAFDTYMQKRTGLTLDQLVNLVSQGRQARQELEAEASVKVFLAHHPEYMVVDDNYRSMLGWLAKYKLGRTLNESNQAEIMGSLYDRNLWTPDTLEEAFEDLSQEGLLELDLAPTDDVGEQPIPQPAPSAQPAAPAPNPRIASVRTGTRAGLGIRTRETATVPPVVNPQPPSDEEFERMSDAEIAAHFAAVRRHVSQTRR